MNYQEAIEVLNRNKPTSDPRLCGKELCTACEVAISAMQELQMYKDNKLCLIPEDVYGKQCDELDEYKKLGTIEEVREAMKEFQIIKSADGDLESCISELEQAKYDIETYWEEPTKLSKATGMAIKALKENQEYKQLGTLDEVREAVEKQRPKKPKGDLNSVPHYRCPNCNGTVKLYSNSDKDKICRWCGQAIDWSKEV